MPKFEDRSHKLTSLVPVGEVKTGGLLVRCSDCGDVMFVDFAPFDQELEGLVDQFDAGRAARVNPLTGRLN